ncbi:transmembrane proteins 14C-domain-containing protein [Scheffersomyces xylosifermentans]|uniref:transmembrane proteins 14C-domain-containing protein n=1 Tax=Scheffersomyces xylosifermentans TaxID=1304137 RepID=UPI00315DB6F2
MEHPSITLSGLCAVGGVMGYVRKGSVPSLVAGLTFSALYGSAAYLLRQNADYGLELALGTSATLLVAGIGRAIPTKFAKPLPLVLVALGGLSSAYYFKKYNEFYPLFG